MTYRDALNSLHTALPTLSAKDADFAQSLLLQYTARQSLSENQWKWVVKLAQPKAAPATVAVGDFGAVVEMFRTASAAKKFPKITLALTDGRPVVLAVAGANARKPGTVNVTDGGRFGSNVWYGRVDPNGTWEMSRSVDGETATAITALLSNFAANPLAVAAAHGHATHSCCFCNRGLTDPRSKTAGYGPICAGKFGLAWG